MDSKTSKCVTDVHVGPHYGCITMTCASLMSFERGVTQHCLGDESRAHLERIVSPIQAHAMLLLLTVHMQV